MKTNIYTFLMMIFFVPSFVHAQWSTDPESPGVVCDEPGTQNMMQSFADGQGGVYVFWLDNRLQEQQPRQIYGQRFNSNGDAMWEAGGRKILSNANPLLWYKVSKLYNDEIILGWISQSDGEFGDSLKIQRLNGSGSKVWPNNLLVSNTALLPNSILALNGYHIIHNNSGYCIAIQAVYYGGSNQNRITCFSSDGLLTGAFDGLPVGTAYGSSGLYNADGNNAYLYYSSSNSIASPLYCYKINATGGILWGPVSVLEGTQGIASQFSGIGDENGITFIWQGYGNGGSNVNLYARRLNASGTFNWDGSVLPICAAFGEQSQFFCRKSGDNYYITWADGRPGTNPGQYDIYAQKFSITGNVLWADDGIQVMSFLTYIPHPKFGFTGNNNLIVCHQTNLDGFVAQKVLDDGSIAWDEGGSQLCTSFYNPFYSEHTEIESSGKMIVVWNQSRPGGGSDNIYITRADDYTSFGIEQSAADQLRIYPNPASEGFTIKLPAGLSEAEITITDAHGREVTRRTTDAHSPDEPFSMQTSELAAGLYFVKVQSGNRVFSQKVIVE